MSPEKLQQLIALGIPKCREPQLWAPALDKAFVKFSITNPAEITDFLAQVAHEAQGLNRVAEDLTYSAERLMVVWPKRFPTLRLASEYAGQPEKLANFVYAGRLGNDLPGDGYKFRGRGLIMTTGKANYSRVAAALGLPLLKAPQLLQDKPVAAMSAVLFWTDHKLGETVGDIEHDTKIINGGETGLAERQANKDRLEKVWASLI